MAFAHFEGEDLEQTEAHVAALHVELEGCRSRGDDDAAVVAELERFGQKVKRTVARGETRLRGAAKETRA